MFEIPHYAADVYTKQEDLRNLREHVLLVVRDYNRYMSAFAMVLNVKIFLSSWLKKYIMCYLYALFSALFWSHIDFLLAELLLPCLRKSAAYSEKEFASWTKRSILVSQNSHGHPRASQITLSMNAEYTQAR